MSGQPDAVGGLAEGVTGHVHGRSIHRQDDGRLVVGAPTATPSSPNGTWSTPGTHADRAQVIDAKYMGTWELPVLGVVTAPTAVLTRPDGYVAWVGEGDHTHLGLADALIAWFGPPTAA